METCHIVELNGHIFRHFKLFILDPTHLAHTFHSPLLPSYQNNSQDHSQRNSIKDKEEFLHRELKSRSPLITVTKVAIFSNCVIELIEAVNIAVKNLIIDDSFNLFRLYIFGVKVLLFYKKNFLKAVGVYQIGKLPDGYLLLLLVKQNHIDKDHNHGPCQDRQSRHPFVINYIKIDVKDLQLLLKLLFPSVGVLWVFGVFGVGVVIIGA